MTKEKAIIKIEHMLEGLEDRKNSVSDDLMDYCQGKIDALEGCLEIVKYIK